MGASNSSGRIPGRSISLEPISKKKAKKNGDKRRQLRSSMHRPVLQLQVKPTTLERVRRRVGSSSSGSFSRNTYTSMGGRDSTVYDNLDPRARTYSNSSRSSDHAHHRRTFSTISRDSMMLLQIVEGDHGDAMVTTGCQEDNYDHLMSKKEFGRLCECTYGRVDVRMRDNGHQEAWLDDSEVWLGKGRGDAERQGETSDVRGGGDAHQADVIYCHGKHGCSHHGLRPSQLILRPPSLVANVEEVRRRIQYHQRVPSNESPSPQLRPTNGSLLSFSREVGGPCELSGTMRKSKSTSELLNHLAIEGDSHPHYTRRGLTLSQSSMEGWECGKDEDMGEWTLGESIMRALSRRDLLVIDIDNPQTQSEVEIMEAWPRLKDEFRRHDKSQSTGDIAMATASH